MTWPLMYVVTPADFPPDARGVGFGFVSACSKLGALTQPNVVALLLPDVNSSISPPPSLLPHPPAPPVELLLPPPPSAHLPMPPRQPFGLHATTPFLLLGLVFTATWGIAFTAAAIQSARHRCAAHLARGREGERLCHSRTEDGEDSRATSTEATLYR